MGTETHPIDKWLEHLPDDERLSLSVPDIWDAAVTATLASLLNDLDDDYRVVLTEGAKKVLTDQTVLDAFDE